MNGNHRLAVAIAAVRIDRNPGSMAELYDARNQRANLRAARLTPGEELTLQARYLSQHAPDLLPRYHYPQRRD